MVIDGICGAVPLAALLGGNAPNAPLSVMATPDDQKPNEKVSR